jgi:hypothetical protein
VAAGSGHRQGFTGDGGQSFEGPSRAAVLLSALKCVDSLMRACSTGEAPLSRRVQGGLHELNVCACVKIQPRKRARREYTHMVAMAVFDGGEC